MTTVPDPPHAQVVRSRYQRQSEGKSLIFHREQDRDGMYQHHVHHLATKGPQIMRSDSFDSTSIAELSELLTSCIISHPSHKTTKTPDFPTNSLCCSSFHFVYTLNNEVHSRVKIILDSINLHDLMSCIKRERKRGYATY